MGVFKEEAHAFETIERNQNRIYNDAADYGYSYNTNSVPSNIKELISAVKGLQKLDKQFPEEAAFIRHRDVSDDSVNLTIRIAWEREGTMYHGTEYTIGFQKVNKHPSLIDKNGNAFISVNSKRYSEPI